MEWNAYWKCTTCSQILRPCRAQRGSVQMKRHRVRKTRLGLEGRPKGGEQEKTAAWFKD